MADNDYDPAGSTQMFRAFVDEGTGGGARRGSSGSGSRTGVIVAVVAAAAVIGAVLWFALG